MDKIHKEKSWIAAFEAYKKSVENLNDDDVLEALEVMLNLKAKRTKSLSQDSQQKN